MRPSACWWPVDLFVVLLAYTKKELVQTVMGWVYRLMNSGLGLWRIRLGPGPLVGLSLLSVLVLESMLNLALVDWFPLARKFP